MTCAHESLMILFTISQFFPPAFYGSIFAKDHEGAYSNYRLWESVGFLMAYILQTKICVFTKLWILSAFLLVGMIGYFVVEILVKRENSVSKR